MAIYDLVTAGKNATLNAGSSVAKWVVGTNENGSKSGLPSIISSVQKFSDSLTYEKCTQFADEGLDFTGVGGCKPTIQGTLSKFTKSNFASRYINKFTSAVDMAKNTIGNTVSNLQNKFGQSYYCTVLAPTFKILLELLEGLIEKPKKILALIYKYIEKILEIIRNLVNKLFNCFEAAIAKFKSILDNLKAPDYLSFMQGVTVWSERCEVIAGPIVTLFNNMVADKTIKGMYVDLGVIGSMDDVVVFESIQDVNKFLKMAMNFSKRINDVKDRVLNRIYNSSPIQKAEYGYKLMKATTQYAMAIVMQKILSPLLRLNSLYNNMLHTRSRYLGIVVNSLIGWLFPPKGYAHNYEDNIIKRRRYSIADVLIICDSLHDCNDYLCGGISNRVKQMFEELKLNRDCWWLNPLISANEYLDSAILALEKAYSNAFTPTKSTQQTLETFINVDFIKSIRTFGNVLYSMEDN